MRWPDRKTKNGWFEYKIGKKTRRHIPGNREQRLKKVDRTEGRRAIEGVRTKSVRQADGRVRQFRTSQPRYWQPVRVKRNPYPNKRFYRSRSFAWTESYSIPVMKFFQGWMEAIRSFGNPEVADAMEEKVTMNPTLH